MGSTTGERATRGQLTVLNAGLTEHGAKKREHRVAIVAGLAGRPNLTSTRELSREQASSILRHLDLVEQAGEMQLLIEQYRPAATS
ncbi:hypothetical protein [Amycolatopsis sp. NPDC051128]|uniref:hypothetical protein n=1 Tax=Amycolatopsis sp. NPDC051128 TaxID=3155412 RepID=UPI003443B74B